MGASEFMRILIYPIIIIIILLLSNLIISCNHPKIVKQVGLVVTVDSTWTIISTDGFQCTRSIKDVPKLVPGDSLVCVWSPR